jgi:predicted DNA-binding protein
MTKRKGGGTAQRKMTLRLPDHLMRRLDALKALKGEDKAVLIRAAIEDYLRRHGVLMLAEENDNADLAS